MIRRQLSRRPNLDASWAHRIWTASVDAASARVIGKQLFRLSMTGVAKLDRATGEKPAETMASGVSPDARMSGKVIDDDPFMREDATATRDSLAGLQSGRVLQMCRLAGVE